MKTGKSPTDGFYRSAASAPEIPLSSATINTQLFTGIFQPTPPIFLSFWMNFLPVILFIILMIIFPFWPFFWADVRCLETIIRSEPDRRISYPLFRRYILISSHGYFNIG